jgi:ribosomal protein S18 acetylase RimI-like enzyme
MSELGFEREVRSRKKISSEVTIRPGTVADSYTAFNLFEQTLADLTQRLGSTTPTSFVDSRTLARMWAERCSLYEHLALSAHHFQIAEQDGQAVGFARSILRGELQQLTEIFIRPEVQSSGMGRELIRRTFSDNGTALRSIIATTDVRAQSLYLKAGVYPRFPLFYFGRQPEKNAVEKDLVFQPFVASPENLAVIGDLDLTIVGHRRDIDHKWLSLNRQGYLYYRDGEVVGYGYTGSRDGPFALQETSDFPAVLAHAENQALMAGRDEFGVEVPMINQTAVDYLLGRGFRIDSFMAIFMSNVPFGQFENYIVTSPPFFI